MPHGAAHHHRHRAAGPERPAAATATAGVADIERRGIWGRRE